MRKLEELAGGEQGEAVVSVVLVHCEGNVGQKFEPKRRQQLSTKPPQQNSKGTDMKWVDLLTSNRICDANMTLRFEARR